MTSRVHLALDYYSDIPGKSHFHSRKVFESGQELTYKMKERDSLLKIFFVFWIVFQQN